VTLIGLDPKKKEIFLYRKCDHGSYLFYMDFNGLKKSTVSPGSKKLPQIHINNNFRDKKME